MDKLTKLFDHNDYCNYVYLEKLNELNFNNLLENFNDYHGSIRNKFIHILYAHNIWFNRITLKNNNIFENTDYFDSLGKIKTHYSNFNEKFMKWLYLLNKNDLNKMIKYKRKLNNDEYTQPIWEILYHIIIHSNFHRAQIESMVKKFNLTMPDLDFIIFARGDLI